MTTEHQRTPIEELFQVVPEDGIVVHDEADGFHARFSPAPAVPKGPLAAVVVGWGAICGAVAWVAGDVAELRMLIFAGGMVLGLLMFAFRLGQGFMPVEVAASGGVLYFDGDRRPLTQLGGATLDGDVLRVRDVDGAVVGEVFGVSDPVGGWLVAAIDTMVQGARA